MSDSVGRPSDIVTTTDEPADDALLAQAAGGDPTALTTIYERYKTVSYSLALRITTDPALAEDVVQDAFLGAWRNAGRYNAARGSVRTWLLAIVHHRAIDLLRRRRPASEMPEADLPPPSLVLPDIWPEVAGRLDRELIRQALGSLPDPQREAIELAYYGGLTQQEIAARTGAPLGTVKSRVRLGLLQMRGLIASGSVGDPAGSVDGPSEPGS
jgi:RNA polymerase sigma-70 factor (ECF subfamily)